MTEISPSKLYKLTEARAFLSCGNTKIWQLIGEGSLDCRKIGRCAVVTGASLIEFIDRLPRHPANKAAT
jgi:hypothetical protein